MADEEPEGTAGRSAHGDQPPEIRIGDRERRDVDDRLRAAHDDGMLTLTEYDERSRACFAARFRRELEPLVADLPDPGTPPPAEPDATPAPAWHDDDRAPDRSPARRRPWRRRVPGGVVGIVVLGVVAVVGPGVVGADQGAAVFGSRTVAVAPGESSVQVGTLFGSTKVVVPDGTHATTSGLMIFGSTDCDTACTPAAPGAPVVQVSGRGAFGSVDVLTATEAAQRQAGDDRDDDD